MGDLKIEKMRGLDDFLLNSARFQVPQMSSWGRRLKANLIYYQTNYFVLFIVLFLTMGILRPQQVLIGMIGSGGLGYLVHYFSERPGVTERVRNSHPLLCLGGIAAVIYLILGYFFLLAILLPLLVILLHGSMRLRSLGNKVANVADRVGLKKTPMGILMDEFGCVLELLDE